MKRFLFLAGTFVLCGVLTGCGSETQEGLIKDTRALYEQAVQDVEAINKQVVEAMKKFEEGKTTKLDLSDAVKATQSLKKDGENTSEIKRRIEQVRNSITPEEKETYAKKERQDLAEVFQNLYKSDQKLRKTLDEAAKINKTEVDNFRKKLTEAEAAFPLDNRS